MERAAEFTAVPGWGGVAMGLTAIGAAWIASRQSSPRAWLIVWLVEAFVAVAIAASSAATKAHRGSARLLSGRARKFLLSFTPPIIVGGLLTFALFQAGVQAALPGVWLLLYGTRDCYGRGLLRASRTVYGGWPSWVWERSRFSRRLIGETRSWEQGLACCRFVSDCGSRAITGDSRRDRRGNAWLKGRQHEMRGTSGRVKLRFPLRRPVREPVPADLGSADS